MKIERTFMQWADFTAHCDGDTDCDPKRRQSRGGTAFAHEDILTADYAEAQTLAVEGWRENHPSVRQLSDKIAADIRPHLETSFESYFDVSGGDVDIDRFLSGEPECMIEMMPTKVAKPGRVITLLVSAAFSAGVNGEEIVKRGAAITALIECIAVCNHSSEVWVEATTGNSRGSVSYLVRVKAADQVMDIDRVMYAIAHPSFLRRHIFAAMERESREVRTAVGIGDCGFGYGAPKGLTRKAEVKPTLALDTMFLGTDPEEWIRKNLAEWGLLAD